MLMLEFALEGLFLVAFDWH